MKLPSYGLRSYSPKLHQGAKKCNYWPNKGGGGQKPKLHFPPHLQIPKKFNVSLKKDFFCLKKRLQNFPGTIGTRPDSNPSLSLVSLEMPVTPHEVPLGLS